MIFSAELGFLTSLQAPCPSSTLVRTCTSSFVPRLLYSEYVSCVKQGEGLILTNCQGGLATTSKMSKKVAISGAKETREELGPVKPISVTREGPEVGPVADRSKKYHFKEGSKHCDY